jgi:hypothetical protein
MIERDGDRLQCLGYAGFLERQEPAFRRWLERLESEISEIEKAPNLRLIELQHALVDLVRELDPQAMRYPDDVLQRV